MPPPCFASRARSVAPQLVRWLAEAFCALCLLSHCAPVPTTTTLRTSPEPSPGPRHDDAFDDRGLRILANDSHGRSGDDAVRARLRLLTAQSRALLVGAIPTLIDEHSSFVRFAPPVTLAEQLGAIEECAPGADAERCASTLGSSLVDRLRAEPVPAALERDRDALLAALAANNPSAVPLDPALRWSTLQRTEGPAAMLAQAFTLLRLSREIALSTTLPPSATPAFLSRLAGELSLGNCASLYRDLHQELTALESTTLSRLASNQCLIACASTALATPSADDPLLEAARTCRDETVPQPASVTTALATQLDQWVRSAYARLRAQREDPAVSAVVAALGQFYPRAQLALPLPWFVTGAQHAIVPRWPTPMQAPAGEPLQRLLFIENDGTVWYGASPRFAPFEAEPPALERSTLQQWLARSNLESASVGIAFDSEFTAQNLIAALAPLARSNSRVQFLGRNGNIVTTFALALTATAPASVLHVGPQRWIATNNNVHSLRSTLDSSAPTAIQLDPDATAESLLHAVSSAAGHLQTLVLTVSNSSYIADAPPATVQAAQRLLSARERALRPCFSPNAVLSFRVNRTGNVEQLQFRPAAEAAPGCAQRTLRNLRLPASRTPYSVVWFAPR